MKIGPVLRDHTAPQDQDYGRRRLRKGAARVALDMMTTGQGIGHGLRAEAMMRGHSVKNLSRMADGMNPVVITRPTKRWCRVCRNDGLDPWQDVDHYHA